MKDSIVTAIVVGSSLIGGAVAAYHAYRLKSIPIAAPTNSDYSQESSGLVNADEEGTPDGMYERIQRISGFIAEGADAFLFAEYRYLAVFCVFFSAFILLVIGLSSKDWNLAGFATIAFILGALTSVVSGFIGMRIAVTANSRTAIQARWGYEAAFTTAFKAGMVMGYGLVALGIVVLYATLCAFTYVGAFKDYAVVPEVSHTLFEAVAGYGLGGSSIALFARVGGGIYTKAADVGADLSGKVCNDFPEDDPRNPAVIADNVGDNVGDIAGMGADLFGSLAEGSCACMVIASAKGSSIYGDWSALNFPLVLLGVGMIVSYIVSFIATHIRKVTTDKQIEPALKLQLLASTILMTPAIFIVTQTSLPEEFQLGGLAIKNFQIGVCVAMGLWSGLIIGYITEYFTSYSYSPVKECAKACEAGAAPNVIYGLALGYKSCIVPVICLCATIYVSHTLAGMFGIATAAMGILSTISTGLTIDAYGPICDNAGGIAEMCHMPHSTRERTDELDAAGNTTAAIGKGFAIGSAALVSLALFGAFVTASPNIEQVDILKALPFAGLLFGAMIPYWFSAMTMKSVGVAAFDMVKEVERQLDVNTESGRFIRQNKMDPNYAACIDISTKASLREMIAPGALVILTPIIIGFIFGVECLAGVLAGNLVSGVQIAISASNTGGAWDNAKKFLSSTGRKGSEEYKAAVVGDTVGDPLKDTSGPSINILIKLSAIISVVFARSFPSKGWLFQLIDKIRNV